MALCIHGNEHCPNRRCREDAVERFEREVTGITGDMTLNELFEHVDGDASRFRSALRKLGQQAVFERAAITWGLELHERQMREAK